MKTLLTSYLLLLLVMSPGAVGLVINAEISTPTLRDGTSANATLLIETDTQIAGRIILGSTNLILNWTNQSFSEGEFTALAAGFRLTKIISVLPTASGSYTLRADIQNATGGVLTTTTDTGDALANVPTIVSTSPAGSIVGKSAVLRVTTDIPASCSYRSNTSSDILFATTGGSTHETILNNLAEGSYVFTVGCNAGGPSSEKSIVFNVDYPPKAEIVLDKESPVRNGFLSVTVLASEELIGPPILTYAYDADPAVKYPVALSGSGTRWSGYIILNEQNRHLIANFAFEGTDLKGNKGTEITEGNLFVIDTIAPPAPRDLRVVQQHDGSMQLEWIYEEEPVAQFTIFRSTKQGVTKLDTFATINATTFTDYSVSDKVTYYYTVNAIDGAGNEGPLATEAYGTVHRSVAEKSTANEEEEPPKVLPPDLVPLVDAALQDLYTARIDIEEAKLRFETESSEPLLLLGTTLGLPPLYAESQQKLGTIEKSLLDLKEHYATREELDASLQSASRELQALRARVPRWVQLLDQNEFFVVTSEATLNALVEKQKNALGVRDDEIKSFIRQNTQAQKALKVTGKSRAVHITFLNGNEAKKTVITKRIVHEQPTALSDVLVFEEFPLSVVSDVSEIDARTPNYEILDEHTMKWGVPQIDFGGTDIHYIVGRELTSDEVKQITSVVLLSPVQLEELAKNNVIGFSLASVAAWAGVDSVALQFVKGAFLLLAILGVYALVTSGKVRIRLRSRKDTQTLEIQRLIQRVYLLVFQNDFPEALSCYKKIRELYAQLPKDLQKDLYKDCALLHGYLARTRGELQKKGA